MCTLASDYSIITLSSARSFILKSFLPIVLLAACTSLAAAPTAEEVQEQTQRLLSPHHQQRLQPPERRDGPAEDRAFDSLKTDKKLYTILWQTLLIDVSNGMVHEVEPRSITKSGYYANYFYFVHRIRLATPLELQDGKTASTYIGLTAIDCTTRMSKVLSDMILSQDGTIVGRNVTTIKKEFSKPAIGSAHDLMMEELCQTSK